MVLHTKFIEEKYTNKNRLIRKKYHTANLCQEIISKPSQINQYIIHPFCEYGSSSRFSLWQFRSSTDSRQLNKASSKSFRKSALQILGGDQDCISCRQYSD